MHDVDELGKVLAASPIFEGVDAPALAKFAPRLEVADHAAGVIVLKKGDPSAAVYFLLSGRLAVRIQRGSERETVAWMQPPDVFGELSFVTGRPCVADIEVVADARVAYLSKEALHAEPAMEQAVLRGLTRLIAERLQVTVTSGIQALPAPVILLHPDPEWEAPQCFPVELARALQRETSRPTLLVQIDSAPDGEVQPLDRGSGVARVQVNGDRELRSTIASRLGGWSGVFPNIVLSPSVAQAESARRAVAEFANWNGYLLGPRAASPPASTEPCFYLQSLERPSLEYLDGSRQLIAEAAESEAAFREGRPAGARFSRTAGSIARLIAGTQVGLALGGGAAWGWAHIGVLEVLEKHGIPVDVIAGCSMGSVIGGLRAAGYSIARMEEIADYWRTRKSRFLEWRIWRFCLLNERVVNKVFRGYFGDRQVNQTEVPYWANAVDIRAGREYTLRQGSLVDCVRGSIGLPGLLPPLDHGAELLVDASVLDPVPVRLVRNMGAKFIIAVNAMVPPEAQQMTARYPFNLLDILHRCMFVMGHEIGQAGAEKNADMIFTPDLTRINMLQFGRSPEIIESGRQAAEQRIPSIQALYARRKSQAVGFAPLVAS